MNNILKKEFKFTTLYLISKMFKSILSNNETIFTKYIP